MLFVVAGESGFAEFTGPLDDSFPQPFQSSAPTRTANEQTIEAFLKSSLGMAQS